MEQWPSLSEVTLVEVEPAMIAAGRELLPDAPGSKAMSRALAGRPTSSSRRTSWASSPYAPVGHLWAEAADTIVFLEPGTPAGYRRVLDARAAVIAAGGHTVAPCPHDLPCPLPPDDWCHFSVRLPRSKLHRHAKGVELGYEDEKYSYAALSREPAPRAAARIIRQPQVRSGHVNLVTCEPDGIHQRTVSRKQGALYKEARSAAWGDPLALQPGTAVR